MTEVVRFRCQNCGYRFETEVLDDHELRQAKRLSRPMSAVHCPQCHRTDIRRGWE
jgi:rubredoxin